MWPESSEQRVKLRTGLTTGACATACCVAAARALLDTAPPSADSGGQMVGIRLPRGQQVELAISRCWREGSRACAATVKDAGDDPDVTHGATVFVELGLSADAGVRFCAGSGVGTVTRKGLVLAVGEPAINPVPRQMMREHLLECARRYDYRGGFEVTVGVEDGERLALKTMNGRLGIEGGLSILGTTGIVRPFSCAAFIASIHQGIDVAMANGYSHIAAATGSSSERAIREHYRLPEMALIEMGDFAGAVLKYVRQTSVPRLSLCGGFGKLSKLANGHLDLHSGASSINFNQLAVMAAQRGADQSLQQAVRTCNTSIEALHLCQAAGVDLTSEVCERALIAARRIVPQSTQLEIWAVDRGGRLIGAAGVPSGGVN